MMEEVAASDEFGELLVGGLLSDAAAEGGGRSGVLEEGRGGGGMAPGRREGVGAGGSLFSRGGDGFMDGVI